jgi:hypothetical protein
MEAIMQTSKFFVVSVALAFCGLATSADARVVSKSGSITREPGEVTRTANAEFANGDTASRSRNTQWDRQAGIASRDIHNTYRDGSSRTVTSSGTRVEPGVFSGQRTVVQRDGDTVSTTKTIDRRR